MALGTVSYWDKSPPYAVLAAARLANIDVDLTPDPAGTKDTVPALKTSSGETIQGVSNILKYVARAAPAAALYGQDDQSARKIDEWIEFFEGALISGPGFEAACVGVASALALKTFFVGYRITVADLAAWGTLLNAAMWPKVRNAPAAVNLLRWFTYCSEQPTLKAAVDELDPKAIKARAMGQDLAAKQAKQGKEGSFEIDLPGARMGGVVTRFPPEPSGYLHIGHAKAALLNQYFADVYKGKLLVRFDDTNPSKESTEFVDNIIEDMKRLGLRFDKITNTSDYFEQMIKMADKLLASGELYADNTDVDTMRDERLKCIPSKCRDNSVEENQRAWKEMLAGSEEGKTYCLRVKMDMTNANACLRDPVAYRCNDHPHWKTGVKYKAYPTYDFACPFVDAIEGVTHALRTSEYKDREEQFYRILEMQRRADKALPHVHIWDYSRLNFVNTVLSKRKLKHLVDIGVVEGWTDPRFPTIQGIIRRGLTIEALKEFILLQGASKNTTLQEWDKIWAMNKKVIDPICPRHTAISTDHVVPVTLSNGPTQLEVATVPKHKKNPSVGLKSLYKLSKILVEQVDAASCEEGEEVTLMDWGNCIFRKIHRNGDGLVTGIDAELHLEGDFKKTRLKVTWLADVLDVVPLQLVHMDHLITKPKLEEEDEFMDFVNKDSWHETVAIGDPNMRSLQQGAIIQLERKGYYRVDRAMTAAGKVLQLFEIPDGKQKKVT